MFVELSVRHSPIINSAAWREILIALLFGLKMAKFPFSDGFINVLQFAFMIHQKNRWATTGRFSHSLRVFASAAHVLSIMTINGECFNRQFNYSKLSEWNILIKSIQHFSFSSTPPTRLHSLTLSSFCCLLAVYFLFFRWSLETVSCHVMSTQR